MHCYNMAAGHIDHVKHLMIKLHSQVDVYVNNAGFSQKLLSFPKITSGLIHSWAQTNRGS